MLNQLQPIQKSAAKDARMPHVEDRGWREIRAGLEGPGGLLPARQARFPPWLRVRFH